MHEAATGLDIWVDRAGAPSDSNILITVSNERGNHTTLISAAGIAESAPEHFVTTPPERVKSGSDKARERGFAVVRAIGYSLLGVLVLFSVASSTGYLKARVVLTGSMKPTINPGDIVITASPNRIPPHIGSIVAYQAREFNGKAIGVFSHRIIGGNAQMGWIVKGDNNPSPDIQKPMGADILGVKIFVIPFIGKFLTKQALFFLIPIVVGIWIAFDGLREAPSDE